MCVTRLLVDSGRMGVKTWLLMQGEMRRRKLAIKYANYNIIVDRLVYSPHWDVIYAYRSATIHVTRCKTTKH